MLTNLDRDDPVFDSRPFTDDEVAFNLLQQIRRSPDPLLVANSRKSFIAGRSDDRHPMWIWTSEGISGADTEELKDWFVNRLRRDLDLIARPEIAAMLGESCREPAGGVYSTGMVMESMKCENPVLKKRVDGGLSPAVPSELPVLQKFLSGFIRDCMGTETTEAQQLEPAKRYLSGGGLFFWRFDGVPVAMANLSRCSERHSRINEVYTLPAYRGRGIAAAMVYEECKIILSEGKIPVLYVDVKNPYSNRAYRSVGFTPCGRVAQIAITYSSIEHADNFPSEQTVSASRPE